MAIIDGTAGADLLFGAAAADLISGGDGNDRILGGAGGDELRGGDGDDVLEGETGDDRLDGGSGNDSLSSTDQGDDTLLGGDGNDTLYVVRTVGSDSLALDGGAGNDRIVIDLRAAAAALAIAAGDGDDAVDVFAIRSSLALSLGAGRDILTQLDFRTTVQGGGRIVIGDFEAGAAGDRISFSSLTAFDFTGWNLNANPFAAGYLKAAQSGNDVVISASFTANGTFVDAITLNNVLLSNLTPANLGGWTWDGSPVPAQTITGTAAAEILRGNGGADEIFGLDGDDVLEGHAGSDTLWGGEGHDTLRGGQGSDQLHGGEGNDSLGAETGGDMLWGDDGDDRLSMSAVAGVAGSLGALGGSGTDTISISGASTTASYSVDAGTGDDQVAITSLGGVASIALGDGRDRLDLDNWFRSSDSTAAIEVTDFATGDGGDRLEWTGFLMRSLVSAPGPDFYTAGALRLLQSGADTLLQIDLNGGGDQFVTLIAFRSTTATAFTSYNLGGFGPASTPTDGVTITGTGDADRLMGTDGSDEIEGLDGRDVLIGLHGDDTLIGGGGDDVLFGYDGDDVLQGGDGNDVFNPGRGDDLIDGGEGNDALNDPGSGSKGFLGGPGDDSARFYRGSGGWGGDFFGSGGEGNDYFAVESPAFNGSIIVLDGGPGDDLFEVAGYMDVTLGAGQDRLRFVDRPWPGEPAMIVRDFAAGDAGDRLEFSDLFRHFTNFDAADNPFLTGHLILSGGGPNTYVMADLDGTGGSNWSNVAVLIGVTRYSLTSHNLGGYATPWTFGTAADETFQGDEGLNEFVGGGGNDIFLIGFGGRDVAVGGTGNDLFYAAFGGSYSPGVSVTGGGGSDILQIQAKAAEARITLQAGSSHYDGVAGTGIGTVEFLSGFDSSRNWAFGAPVKYVITLGDGFAPTGAPLVVDTTRLAASESFSLENGSFPDPDAFVRLIGGAAADRVRAGAGGTHLDGGGGGDELYTGVGDDILLGGDGSDKLYAVLGWTRSGADRLDGGEGNDTLSLTGNGGQPWTSLTIEGGAGDDVQILDLSSATGTVVADIDLGTGADRLNVGLATGTFDVTLGAGRDTIEFVSSLGGAGIAIADFDAGPDGDVVVWQTVLNHLLSGYSRGTNPFQSSHVRLLQDGGDVLLQVSPSANGNFMTMLRFKNHLVADFAGGIGGFVPVPANGTPYNDVLVGTDGRDDFDGQAGNDSIDGRGGADRMAGGSGDDIFYVDDQGDEVIELSNGGSDEIRTGLASYSLASRPEVERLTGTSNDGQILTGNMGSNSLVGGGGNDVLTGDGGYDVLDGGAGADTMRGGSDDDVYYVDHANDVVEEASNGGFDTIRTSLASYSLVGTHVERLFATSDIAHTFRGNAELNDLGGGAGNDLFLLQDGGSDLAYGGDGNDIFYFGAASHWDDLVFGGPGRDAIVFQGHVTVQINTGSLNGIESISIQSGANGFFGDTANNLYDYDLTLANGNVVAGQQLIVNAQSLRAGEDFTFDGSAETAGRFLIYGGRGVDDLTGGDGADVFFFEGARWGADDRVDGGAGRDALVISAGDGLTHIEFAAYSFTNIESISLNNLFASDPTQKPSYDIVLHNGNVAPGGTLIVNGNSIALGQVVHIDGRGVHDGNLMLFAGGGHDVVTGGDGNDLILGGGGQDSVSGAGGADTFRYDSVSDSAAGANDLIGDFQTGLDKVDLSRIDANTHSAGNQAFSWIGSSAFSGNGAASAGELRVFEQGGYQRIEGDTNGDGAADLVIVLQLGTAPLVQGDFLP